MLNHHTAARLQKMNLKGMAEAYLSHSKNPEFQGLSFDERFGMLVDFEYTYRQNRRLARLLSRAQLKVPACLEDVDYSIPRGLDSSLVRELSTCQWIDSRLNVLVTGPTGMGKTFLACALANAACRHGLSSRYYRVSLLLSELTMARGDGSFMRLLRQLSKYDLLILDDWALAPFTPDQARDLLEVIDARTDAKSMVIASQIPMNDWHKSLPDPTLADAILDRIMHNSHRITLKGDSVRRNEGKKKLAASRSKKN